MNAYGKATLVAAALLFTAPAFAQTEADCETAVQQTQNDADNNAELQTNDGRAEELATNLARASTAGIDGDYEKCLEMVRDARGAAGLRVD